jgi:lipoyl-dependent peroxiredoxin
VATDRKADVVWQGDLMNGSGTITTATSGALPQLDVSWPSRSESPNGKTSPEELIAAAWASCFSMALAHGLAQGGNAPERLQTSATVTFQPGEGIVRGALTVLGTVSGLDESGFREAAEAAKSGCPVSKALAGIPEVTLDARLDSSPNV